MLQEQNWIVVSNILSNKWLSRIQSICYDFPNERGTLTESRSDSFKCRSDLPSIIDTESLKLRTLRSDLGRPKCSHVMTVSQVPIN